MQSLQKVKTYPYIFFYDAYLIWKHQSTVAMTFHATVRETHNLTGVKSHQTDTGRTMSLYLVAPSSGPLFVCFFSQSLSAMLNENMY
jgi:hypothetical protein